MLVLSRANASHPTYHSTFFAVFKKPQSIMYPSIFFSGPLPISRQDAGEAGAAHLRGHAAFSQGRLAEVAEMAFHRLRESLGWIVIQFLSG